MFFSKKKKKEEPLSGSVEFQSLERQLRAISKTSGAIVGILDIDKVMATITDSLVDVIDVSFAIILEWDENNNRLNFKRINIPDIVKDAVEKGLGKSVDQVFFEIDNPDHKRNHYIRALVEGKVLESNDLYESAYPLMSKTAARLAQKLLGAKKSLSIPLLANDKKLGVLGVIWKKEIINQTDKEVVSTFANQISIAIYNARLFSQVQNQVKQLDERSKDLESLFEMSKAAIKKIESENTVQEILDAVPQQFDHLGYVGAGFFTYDEDTRKIKVKSMTSGEVFENITNFSINGKGSRGFSVEKYPNSIFAKSLLQEDYITFDDFSLLNPETKNKKEIKKLQKELGIQSGLMLKVFLRGLIPGILFVATKRPVEDISDRDRRMMHSLVNNFSLAYENARLYKKTVDQLEDVKQANEDLKRLDEAKTNFVSIASHQLRTPVSGILGYLSMLYEGDFGEMKSKQKEVIEMNLANIERLNKLIDTFLDVTKIEAGKLVLDKQICDLSEIITDVLKEFDHQVAVKGLKLIFKQPEKKSAAVCDSERIRHAIANLVDNAIKYTPDGSIEVSLDIQNNKEIMTVKDTGVGIKTDEVDHLFQKFVRASGGSRINANGSGLGLYIVKRIIEGHEGKVWVESDGEGKGASFHIELKRSDDKARSKRKHKDNKK